MGLMSVTVAEPAARAESICVGAVLPKRGSRALFDALYVEKYTARAGTTPASIGPQPFQNLREFSWVSMHDMARIDLPGIPSLTMRAA